MTDKDWRWPGRRERIEANRLERRSRTMCELLHTETKKPLVAVCQAAARAFPIGDVSSGLRRRRFDAVGAHLYDASTEPAE
jgi:hypothetical protein